MMRDDFAVMILSHGRAKEQKTRRTLLKCGYTGKIYIVIDDMDDQQEEYRKLYGAEIIVFNKQQQLGLFDTMCNADEWRSVVYARNACYEIAEGLGLKYFLMCDDDISDLKFRLVRDGKLGAYPVRQSDRLFESIIALYENTDVSIFGFSQCGAYIGGANSKKYRDGCQRTCSQMMMIRTQDKTPFNGIFNEDLHVAIESGLRGKIVLSTMLVSIASPVRESNSGGLHDLYKANGSYTHCSYTVMAYPGIAKVSVVQESKLRLKHSAIAPEILSGRWKK